LELRPKQPLHREKKTGELGGENPFNFGYVNLCFPVKGGDEFDRPWGEIKTWIRRGWPGKRGSIGGENSKPNGFWAGKGERKFTGKMGPLTKKEKDF